MTKYYIDAPYLITGYFGLFNGANLNPGSIRFDADSIAQLYSIEAGRNRKITSIKAMSDRQGTTNYRSPSNNSHFAWSITTTTNSVLQAQSFLLYDWAMNSAGARSTGASPSLVSPSLGLLPGCGGPSPIPFLRRDSCNVSTALVFRTAEPPIVVSNGNMANYGLTTSEKTFSEPLRVTSDGMSNDAGPSAYGTFGQDGNAYEWNDLEGTAAQVTVRGLRGGYWGSDINMIGSQSRLEQGPVSKVPRGGFRYASSEKLSEGMALVGDTNNIADANGRGRVDYSYYINKYPLMIGEYVLFLNNILGGPRVHTSPLAISIVLPNTNYTRSSTQSEYYEYNLYNPGVLQGDASSVVNISIKKSVTTASYVSGFTSNEPLGFEYVLGYSINRNKSVRISEISVQDLKNIMINGAALCDSALLSENNIQGVAYLPALNLSWFDCARYVNWRSNGSKRGLTGGLDSTTTENGAYTLNGRISGSAVAKNLINPNTGKPPTYWIPTEDEWYKAAYYKGAGVNTGYWKYATQNDSPPRKPLNLSTSCVGISIKEPQPLFPAVTTPSYYVIDLGQTRTFNLACYDASPVGSLSQTNSIATTTQIALDTSVDGQPHAGDDNKWQEVHGFIDVGQVNQGVRVIDGTATRDASLIDGGIPDIKVFNSTNARYIRLRLYNRLGTTVCLRGFRLFQVGASASDPNAPSLEPNSNTRSLSLFIKDTSNYLLAHEYNKAIGGTDSKTYPGANFLTNVGTNGGPSYYGTYGQGDYPNELIGDGSQSNIFSLTQVALNQSQRSAYLRPDYCTYAGFGLRLASSVPNNNGLVSIGHPNDITNTLVLPQFLNFSIGQILVKSLDVGYSYYIQKYKTTLREYTTFLNAIAKSDPNGLSTDYYLKSNSGIDSITGRGGSLGAIVRSGPNTNYTYTVVRTGDRLPITRLGWVDCARYANWMSNGQPTGLQTSKTTENGAYNLSSIGRGAWVVKNSINPNTGKPPTYWIPTLAEWLKAGFYKGPASTTGISSNQMGLEYYYYQYATRSDIRPESIDMVLPHKNGAIAKNITTNVNNPSVSVGKWIKVSAADANWVGTIYTEDLIAPPPPPATPTKSPNTTPRSTRNFVLCPDPTPTPTPAAGLIDNHIRCPFSLTLSGLTPGRRYISEAHIYDINSEISKIIPPSITFRAQSNGIQHLSFIAYRNKNTNRSVITIETQSPGNPTDRDTSSVVLDISLEDLAGSCQVPCIEYPCPTPTPASVIDNLSTTVNYNNGAIWNNQIGNVSTVGTNGVSSTYGTFDQNGNVWEWLETGDHLNVRYLRGGSYSSQGYELQSRNTSGRKKAPMTSYSSDKGFRIATYTNPYNFQPTCFIIINDSCNIADSNGLGATPYVYHMSKYEVTNKEYVEFLNTQAYFLESKFLDSFKSEMSSSPLGGIIRILCKDRYTYSTKTNMRFKPVNFVSWIDATRYCNWLHNNKTLEDIQTGAYQLKNPNLARTSDAKYFLPTENEWYKAAYYDPNMNENKNRYYPGIYSLYATASNKLPTPVTVNAGGVGTFPSGDLSCLYDAVVLKDIIRQDCDTCTEQIISLELEGNNSCFSEVEYRLVNNNTGVGIGTEWTKLPTDGVPDSLARYGCSDGPPSRFYTPISHKFTGRGDPDAQYVKQSLWVRTGDTWNTQGKFPCGISYQYSMTVHSIINPCNVSSTGYFSYDGSISCCEGAAVANPAFSTGSLVNPNELPGFVLEYTNCDKCPPGCYNTETVTC